MSQPKLEYDSGPRQTCALAAAIFGSGMAFVDGTVVNVATARLQTTFSATVGQVQWVVEAYALTLSALLLIGGRLGDIYGRKRVFIWGNALFALASLVCGLAGSLVSLVIARGFQGIAAALLIPGSLALITSAYPAEKRGWAIGIWSGATAMMGAVGPFVGGWLIDHLSWRAAFYMSLPMAACATIAVLQVSESRNESDRRTPNWTGTASVVIALGAVTFALLQASTTPVPAAAAAGASLLFFAIFVNCEQRAEVRLFPVPLLKSGTYVAVNMVTLFLYAALSGAMFYLPLTLIQVHHYKASEAGAALAPMILTLFVLSPWTGGLLGRYSVRSLLTAGSSVVAAAFLMLCMPGVDGSYWSTFFVPMLVLGVGMSICVSPLTTTVMNSAPDDLLGVASGINNAVSRVAGLLAIAVFGVALTLTFNLRLDKELAPLRIDAVQKAEVDSKRPLLAAARYTDASLQGAVEASFIDAFRCLMVCSAALSLLSAACAWRMLKTSQEHESA